MIDQDKLKWVLLTHAHIDHAAELEWLLDTHYQKTANKAIFYAHKAEEAFRQSLGMYAQMMGQSSDRIQALREPDHYLEDQDVIALGACSLKALFTPGHSPGHVSFFCKEGMSEIYDLALQDAHNTKPVLIAGDALFRGSIGRTDLPGSVHQDLIDSIKEKLFVLPEESVVLCGHGPHTTIGFEKQNNPFLQ